MAERESSYDNVDLDKAEAGDLVRAWCGKCGDFRIHTVKARTLVLGKPPKAVCNTCNAVHLARQKRPGTRKSKKADASVLALSWDSLVGEAEVETWTPYTIGSTYSKDEFVEHRKYGKGKVIRVLGKYKVQILFQMETKTMLQNK